MTPSSAPQAPASLLNIAFVGLGHRSAFFTRGLLDHYSQSARIVGFCDQNQTRMDHYNALYSERAEFAPVPTYKPDGFEAMIAENDVDLVFVTTIDSTHHQYIERAMRAGCDVVVEKPMTIDLDKCRAILRVIEETGQKLTVSFNYRYAPRNARVRELLQAGTIGQVYSVHFEWLLDTRHGAEYFRRWHRDKASSGGLMVHKATHHFDLVNWWLQTEPQTVFGMGQLAFYGRENAEQRGETHLYEFDREHPRAGEAPFTIDIQNNARFRELYVKGEAEDGYMRDRSVFSPGISIEDDMAVMVRYQSGATLTYHLTAYSPWEGFRIAFNGSKGRLEYEVTERPFLSASDAQNSDPQFRAHQKELFPNRARLMVRPHFAAPYEIELPAEEAGHGGGDRRLLADLIEGKSAATQSQEGAIRFAADHRDGALSILTGIAANRSFETGLPVQIADLGVL